MIFEIILTIIVFFGVKALIYYLTDIKGLPAFLNYKPWICYKCFSFWSLLFLYINIFIISKFDMWYILIAGIVLTILDAIALIVDEKNNIISIDEIENEQLEQ